MADKHEESGRYKTKNNKKNQPTNGEGAARYNDKSKTLIVKDNYFPSQHYGKNKNVSYKCWEWLDDYLQE